MVFFMPKSGGLQKHPTSLQSRQTRKQLRLRQLLKIALLGAGTVSPRTAELRDVFSATAFSSRRLVKVAVFMLLKRHQHIQVQSRLNKILSDLAKLLLVPSRYSCTFGQRERLVFVRVLGLCCLPANLMNAGQVIGGQTKRTCNILV